MYLSVNGTDLSGYITEDSFCCEYSAIFDENGGYVNIYGESIRRRTGTKTAVSAVLHDVPENIAGVLRTAFSAAQMDVVMYAPTVDEITAVGERIRLSLSRAAGGVKYYTAEIGFCSSDCYRL